MISFEHGLIESGNNEFLVIDGVVFVNQTR